MSFYDSRFRTVACTVLVLATGSLLTAQKMEDVIVTFTGNGPQLARLTAAKGTDRPGATVEAMIQTLQVEVAQQRAGFATRVAELGGEVRKHFWLINASVVRIPAACCGRVAAMEGVAKVWRNELRSPADAALPVPIRVATNANNHRVDGLQSAGIRGAGVTVALLDSSFDSEMGASGRPHAVFYRNGDTTNRTGPGLMGSRLLANVQVGVVRPDSTVSHGTRVAASAIGGRWNTTAEADHGHAPEASVVGYTLSDLPRGVTELQTMVAAWQQVVRDRATYGTSVVNMSYGGTPLPDSPEQQAMDAAVEVADLFVTVSAGSSAASNFFHGAVNVLPVGAASANTHTVPGFSAQGPLPDQRVYPLVIANGEALFTPEIDDESVNSRSTGASHAAPQVAGAAALFRSVATNATGLETRAAILATTADVSDRATRAQSGYGYLRDDRLVALAQGAGMLRSGSVQSLSRQRSYSMSVIGGATYAVALAWNRQIPANLTWANLDLEVWQDGELLARSARLQDVNERVQFRARGVGGRSVELRVKLITMEPRTAAQPFALAAVESPDAIVSGEWIAYGVGCASPPSPSATQLETTPDGFVSTFGSSGGNGLFGGAPHRFQIVARQFLRTARTIHAIAFRFDNGATAGQGPQWVDLEIDVGQSPGDLRNLGSTFADNRSNTVVQVVARRRIILPPQPSAPTSPTDWTVVVPLDQSFSTYPDRGGLVVDVRVYGSSAGLDYPVDAVPSTSRVLYAASPTATVGTIGLHPMPIVGLVPNLIPGATPELSATGVPDLGRTFAPTLTGARPNAPILFVTGVSGTRWGGAPLPLDLGLLGAPGCFLAASLDVIARRTADQAGTLTLSVAIPRLPNLVGARFFQQALCVDPRANGLGLTTSNGMLTTIGGR